VRESLSAESWTVRAVGDLTDVPPAIHGAPLYAKVPGCVHTDLLRAGLLADPNLGSNEQAQRWVGNTDWQYRCTFTVDRALLARQRHDLVCDGLDTIATLMLNGRPIGDAANMHHPHRFDVRAALQPGENELVITLAAPLRHIRAEEARLGKRPVNGDWDPYPYIRKMASNFGWDWGPRVPTSGIWREIALESWNSVRLAGVRPLVRRAEAPDEWHVQVCADLEWSDAPPDTVQLVAELRDGDRVVASGTVPVAPSATTASSVCRY